MRLRRLLVPEWVPESEAARPAPSPVSWTGNRAAFPLVSANPVTEVGQGQDAERDRFTPTNNGLLTRGARRLTLPLVARRGASWRCALSETHELKSVRENAGLSLRQVGDLAGLDASTVCLYENGLRRPSPENARRWRRALAVLLAARAATASKALADLVGT